MSLTFQDRRAGDISIVACSGRIVEGPEAASLKQHIEELLSEGPYVVLHLAGVDFIDSSGIGLLVRLLTRAHNARGGIGICAASPKVREALRVTHLEDVFQPRDSELDAIAILNQHRARAAVTPSAKTILCVDPSADVLAYVRELLRSAGHDAVTTDNLVDALTLLTVHPPSLIVINCALRSARDTRAARLFNERADRVRVVELDSGFSTGDAGLTARDLLRRIEAELSSR